MQTYCGNKVLDPGEVCDDGNWVEGDGCSADCFSDESCGNGVVDWDAGETCDIADPQTKDGCTPECLVVYCGDGKQDPGEVCDDGNWKGGDGCSPDCKSTEKCGNGITDWEANEECDPPDGSECSLTCRMMFCGNGTMDPGEVCDDGNWTGGDDCSPDCQSTEVCGNGIVDWDVGEQCDPPDPAGKCSGICRLMFCGNKTLDPVEVCDDGNWKGGDGCSPDCKSTEVCGNGVTDWEAGETCDPPSPADLCSDKCKVTWCGDGTPDPGEVCDDGNWEGGDGCSPDCLSNETCGNGIVDWEAGENCDTADPKTSKDCSNQCKDMSCGNSVLDPGEQCDDGNWTGGDGCAADCKKEACGNGIIDWDAGEECDPPSVPANCSPTCKEMACGNGVVDPGEKCDDGNWTGGDGCSAGCDSIEICGNSIVDWEVGEECDPPSVPSNCSPICKAMYCGNGVKDLGEVCDDGNWVDGDGCSSDCNSLEVCGNNIVDWAKGEECDPPSVPDNCSPQCKAI